MICFIKFGKQYEKWDIDNKRIEWKEWHVIKNKFEYVHKKEKNETFNTLLVSINSITEKMKTKGEKGKEFHSSF